MPETSRKPHYHGHRERLRERFIATDGNGMPDYEILELLLTLAIPRGDVKPVAKALVDRFGSLGSVLSAEPEAVYCVGAQPTYDSGSGTITTFSCSSLNFISASAWDAIVNTNGLIAPLRVSSAVVMPSVQLLL